MVFGSNLSVSDQNEVGNFIFQIWFLLALIDSDFDFFAQKVKIRPSGVTNTSKRLFFTVFCLKLAFLTQISTENESGLKQRESDFKK